jgi:Ca2+-binding EF-hand superfamily protein
MEALTFLVSNIHTGLDFKSLREAFRCMDKHNTGILTLEEIKQAFIDSNVPLSNIEEIFKCIDI